MPYLFLYSEVFRVLLIYAYYLFQAGAAVFSNSIYHQIDFVHRKDQIWILATREPPRNARRLISQFNQFNWTITYR